MYALGVITGLLVAILVVATLTFFRSQVERKTHVIERWLERNGPRPTGGVFIPEDDADVVRKAIIDGNNKRGIDTKLSELM